jgi:hypothetical protein
VAPIAFALVIGVTVATVYDVTRIAGEERATPGWSIPQALIATPLAAVVAVDISRRTSEGIDPFEVAIECWLAGLGGFGTGTLVDDRPQAGGVGAAMGMTGAAAHHGVLGLFGAPSSRPGFVTQAVCAVPGVAAGAAWAAQTTSDADRVGGVALASIGGVTLIQGVTSAILFRPRPPPDASSAFEPRVALTCSPSPARCTLDAHGRF